MDREGLHAAPFKKQEWVKKDYMACGVGLVIGLRMETWR